MHRQARRRLTERRRGGYGGDSSPGGALGGGGYNDSSPGGSGLDSQTVHTGGGYDDGGQGQMQFYPYLEQMRAPFAQELAQDPQLRSTLAAVAAGEYEEYPHQMLEVLMNRAAYMGGTLRQGIYGFPGVDRGRSPYGPVRTGKVNSMLNELQNSPKRMGAMNAAIDDVLRGSNQAQLRTDQGSASLGDPNSMNPSGRMLVGPAHEVLNDWNGPGGSAKAAEWRMQNMAQLGDGALGDPSAPMPAQVATATPSAGGVGTLTSGVPTTPNAAGGGILGNLGANSATGLLGGNPLMGMAGNLMNQQAPPPQLNLPQPVHPNLNPMVLQQQQALLHGILNPQFRGLMG